MKIKFLIGLGNPGDEYQNTFHNVGHLFIDSLAGTDAKFKRTKYFDYCQTNDLMTNDSMTLIKPSTFMNQSGGAVAAAKKHFKIKTSEILIIHDDSDIPLGSFKLSFGRGSAGHQGIKSIIKALKTKNFYRLRIGVRSLPALPDRQAGGRQARRKKAGELVLKRIGAREKKILENLFLDLRIRYF